VDIAGSTSPGDILLCATVSFYFEKVVIPLVQYTTPEFTFVINDDGVDLTTAANVYVTFKQSVFMITKTGEDLTIEDSKTIKVSLSQEESTYFSTGPLLIQINWTFLDENDKLQRVSTGIKQVQLTQNLLSKVVE